MSHTRPGYLTRWYLARNVALVDGDGTPRDGSPTTIHGSEPSRRRPPNDQEQAKREAWGKFWGQVNSRAAAKLQEEMAK